MTAGTYERLVAEERYRDALALIVAEYGKVCLDFEAPGCRHRSCATSYDAWATAYRALYPDRTLQQALAEFRRRNGL